MLTYSYSSAGLALQPSQKWRWAQEEAEEHSSLVLLPHSKQKVGLAVEIVTFHPKGQETIITDTAYKTA